MTIDIPGIKGETPAASYHKLLQVPGGIAALGTIEDGVGAACGVGLGPFGLNLPVSTGVVSDPPTSAELTALFGAPEMVGAGFVAFVNPGGYGWRLLLVWTTASAWWWARADLIPTYALLAGFTHGDRVLVDGETMTAPFGVQQGSVTVTKKDGSLTVVDGNVAYVGQTTPEWGDLGILGDTGGVLVEPGTVALFRLQPAIIGGEMRVMWQQQADLDHSTAALDLHFEDWGSIGSLMLTIHDADGVETAHFRLPWLWFDDPDLVSDIQFAAVGGGFNSAGESWYPGAPENNYTYGLALFAKTAGLGGTPAPPTEWTLIWRSAASHADVLYPAFSASHNVEGLLLRLAQTAYRRPWPLLNPANSATFTAANGTDLNEYAPECGTPFSTASGAWEIQGNELVPASEAEGNDHTVVEVGASDFMLDCDYTVGAYGGVHGVVIRSVDTLNFLLVQLFDHPSTKRLRLYSVASGYPAVEAHSDPLTFSAGDKFHVRIIAQGDNIRVFLDGALVLNTTLATFETATQCGFFFADAGTYPWPAFDNLTIWPLTNAAISAVLERAMIGVQTVPAGAFARVTEDGTPRVTEDGTPRTVTY